MVLASALLVVAAPVAGLIALAIKLTSPGPVLFRQTRVGHRGQSFPMLKFRTMRDRCDETLHREFVTRMLTGDDPRHQVGRGLYKLRADPRVTPLGAVLRRTSLDELPQLLNVLRGEMSLVGPRPALSWEVELFEERFLGRFDVLPGITGLWQVSGRNRIPMGEALELDLRYVEQRSVPLYLAILLRTLPAALLRQEGR